MDNKENDLTTELRIENLEFKVNHLIMCLNQKINTIDTLIGFLSSDIKLCQSRLDNLEKIK